MPHLNTLRVMVAALASLPAVHAQDDAWHQWRGAARTGHMPAGTAPAQWPQDLERVWQREVGTGHSSPVVDGARVYTLTRRGNDEVVTALDLASGDTVWQATYPVEIGINPYADGHGRWPRSTPLVHDGRLYTLGASAILTAWDAASGEILWRRERQGGVETKELFCGTAMSPLRAGDNLIVHVGDDSGGDLMAVRLSDGVDVWRTALEGPGYASPVAGDIDGTAQLVTLTMSRAVGLAVADGKVLWSVPFDDEWNENIVTPIVHEGLVVVAGVRYGISALRPRHSDGEWTVETVWRDRSTTLYMSSPVLDGNVLYGFSQKRRGSFVALDITDGRTLWSHRAAADNAALLRSGEHLVALTTEGELLVGKATPEGFAPTRRYPVADSPTWAHPAPVAGGLLIKDATAISRWRLPEGRGGQR